MSKFNKTSTGTRTTNIAGGIAYKQNTKNELLSLLLTSFVNEQFYRSSDDTITRLKSLIAECDPKFVAKAAIYARTKFGMRSISHVVASEVSKRISGTEYAKSFFDKIVYRPDDMMEILSYHIGGGNKVPNSMKKGFAAAFDKFDKYQLAKYRAEAKKMKLIDVVNMVHPVPTVKNKEALELLVKNELKSFDTWEVELSAAAGDTEKSAKVWERLISEKKIGYMALLKNLRNISKQAPDMVKDACYMLIDENLIKKSLVMPFRFLTAFDEISKLETTQHARAYMIAINEAIEISLQNVPVFDGETLVVVDVSGSMQGQPSKIASLFASVLLKSNKCDLICFAERASYYNVNTMDSVTTIANALRFSGGGTNFPSIFETANKKYDRIVILSDMQGWIGWQSPAAKFNEYKKRTGCKPFVYSFDLNGYGTLQLPENNVFLLAGFSDKTMSIMSMLESDRQALINEVEKIEL